MNTRVPLTVSILLIAAVNVVALGAAAFVFVQIELGRQFDSVLLTTARERILAVARLIALDLSETEPADRDRMLQRHAEAHRITLLLFRNDGIRIAGPSLSMPREVLDQMTRRPVGPEARRGQAPPAGRGATPEPGDRVPPLPSTPPFLVTAEGPYKYWVGVRLPVSAPGSESPVPGTLVFASATLLGNPFYFQPLPWLGIVATTLAVTALCWLPFVRRLTRAIGELTRATSEIAEGRFDIQVRSRRRDEVGQLARSIERMSGQLKTLIAGQKRFLGDAAHELRSPLARMAVAVGLLDRRADEGTRRHLDDLQEDVELMTRLTDELLAFARSELAVANVQLVPTSVVDAVARAVRLEGADADVRIDVDPDYRVRAEPDLLFRAISNLVRNAVRYAASAGPIVVRAFGDGDHVRISVADHGPGLPPGDLEAVFSPFYRPEISRDRQTGGAGLGLAIVRSAVEACRGSVVCRNLSPCGLEVSIRLPHVS